MDPDLTSQQREQIESEKCRLKKLQYGDLGLRK